jgi:hypothetical protein
MRRPSGRVLGTRSPIRSVNALQRDRDRRCCPRPSLQAPSTADATVEAERNGATDDMTTQVVWRKARTRPVGGHSTGRGGARARATTLAAETDDQHASRRAARRVLRAAGRRRMACRTSAGTRLFDEGVEVAAARAWRRSMLGRTHRDRSLRTSAGIVVVTGASAGIGGLRSLFARRAHAVGSPPGPARGPGWEIGATGRACPSRGRMVPPTSRGWSRTRAAYAGATSR